MKKFELVQRQYQYEFMPKEKREEYLPDCGFCSISPASDYTNALIAAGKGQKAYVFGDPYHETMIFQQEELHYTTYKNPLEPPDLRSILPEVRRLLREGKSKEANLLAIKKAEEQGYDQLSENDFPFDAFYRHPAFSMEIMLDTAGEAKDYLRTMDFEKGEVSIHWTDNRGSFCRNTIFSIENNIFAHKIVNPVPHTRHQIVFNADISSGHHVWEKLTSPPNMDITLEEYKDMLLISCKYDSEMMKEEGYGIITKVIAKDAEIECNGNCITVDACDEIQIFSKIVRFDQFSRSKLLAEADQFSSLNLSYNLFLESNHQILGEMMNRSRVKLSDTDKCLLSTEEMIKVQHSRAYCPEMIEQLYHMGRYFLITETGKLPPAIGQYNINVNLQICSGNITGLSDVMHVFFDFIESKFDDFRLNAQSIFGCRGIQIPIHPSMRSGKATHFSYSWPHQYWVACAAWVYNEFWNYYLVTNDEKFLKERVIPGLTEAALFFEDYLVDRDVHGKLLFYPGMSPECTPKNENQSSLTINTVMDIMACREILDNLLAAHEILGIKHEKMDLWKGMLASLPSLILDEEGGLKEWATKETLEDYNHRCVSHHYDLWPGHAVTWEDTPELAEAIKISNRKRAQENDSAHGIMHRLFCAIRLKDKEDTEHNFRQILEHGFITRSLMTNHYPYNVYFPDITGSFPAAVAEMAIYSNIGILELLPAMPPSLKKGSIRGIGCFNWTKVIHMQWDLIQGSIQVELRSLKTQKLELVYRKGFSMMQVDNKKICERATKATLELEKDRDVHIQLNIGTCK